MNKTEYNAIKKMAATQLGADDADTLNYYATSIEKQAKIYKLLAIILFIFSIPLSLIIIGLPLLIVSICMYFLGYKKISKKAQMFREHVNNDPDLSVS